MKSTALRIFTKCREKTFLLIERSFQDRDLMRLALVNSLIELINESLTEGMQFHLALTGGEMGGEISRDLAMRINEAPEDFMGLHIWWSDERFLPHDSELRNSHSFLQPLLPGAKIHIHESAASDENIDVDACARRYAVDISGVDMDLTILSIGIDGHVASLFPLMWRADENLEIVAVHDAPKSPTERITFSMAKINESKRVWFLASGAGKKNVVARILASDATIPASYVAGREETVLFNDFSSK